MNVRIATDRTLLPDTNAGATTAFRALCLTKFSEFEIALIGLRLSQLLTISLSVLGISEPPTTDMYSMSVDLLGTDLEDLLYFTSDMDISGEPTSNVRILQHFQAFTSLTLGSTKCRSVMHSYVAQKAWYVYQRVEPFSSIRTLAFPLHATPSV